ncbi:MAG: DegT/DnrJ/EryC1/StrS family aminotransferase, partial [Bacteroidales bacterium]|nr:DegT/DnrJ/EryC1/StrS family aminotransferase [Bacteroidales bacterium]
DGGAIFTNDDTLAQEMQCIANHGMTVRYHHDKIGVNSRLDSIQAAILDVKLRYLDSYISARQAAAQYYDKAFANQAKIAIPARNPNSTHVFHQYTLKLHSSIDRNAVQEKLKTLGIPAMLYYPVPLHLQKAYRNERYQEGDFPNAETLSQTVLSLPMHTELDEEQLEYITQNLCKLLQ